MCVILFTGWVSVPACTTVHMIRGVSVRGLYLGGGLCPRGSLSGLGVSVQGVSVQVGGSLSRGSLTQEGLCLGVSVRETPQYGNEWAVHILLECILVYI